MYGILINHEDIHIIRIRTKGKCIQMPQTDLLKRNIFSHNSGSWKSKIKVLATLISDMTSLLGLKTLFTVLTYSLCSVCAPGVSLSLFLYDTNAII